MSLRLMITGGTIDKQYDMFSGDNTFENTHIPAMLERARITGQVAFEYLFMKDSLDMNDIDRTIIAAACQNSPEDQIVITHGTDTMVETGQAIKRRGIAHKTIVLTGAMIPYSMGESSDALFNLGTAVAYAQSLASGIYVAMNGRSFDIDTVYKDVDRGLFVANS